MISSRTTKTKLLDRGARNRNTGRIWPFQTGLYITYSVFEISILTEFDVSSAIQEAREIFGDAIDFEDLYPDEDEEEELEEAEADEVI